MIEIDNSKLAGPLLKCFNPSLVYYQGRQLLYYRYTPQPSGIYTCIAFVKLSSNFHPVSQHRHVHLPRVTNRVLTIDDPRAFVWREELWLMHIQAAQYQHPNQWSWSTSIVLTRVDLAGQGTQVYVPDYGRNINYAVADAIVQNEDSRNTPIYSAFSAFSVVKNRRFIGACSFRFSVFKSDFSGAI